MRKRVSRPRRFAAVDNGAIDGLPSILSVGLLTCLIRAKDGDDVTVESLTESYDEGEKSLSKAMRALVNDAYVVKFKLQRAVSEVVEEEGKEVTKRGGSWYTTFTVDSIPFTAEDVAVMVEEILAEGNVKSYRVEPERLDPRKRPKPAGTEFSSRPTPPNGGVGATCGNSGPEGPDEGEDESRPTPPSPGVGQGGAHIRNETSSARARDEEDGDALAARSAGDGRRPSYGSSAREVEGGFAASSKDHPAPAPQKPRSRGKSDPARPKHTRQQLDIVRAVRAHFPPDLLNGWTHPETGKHMPPLPEVWELSQAILEALAGDVPAADRTVAQLGARIERRWNHHGWATKYYAGAVDSLVGAAVALVRPLKASDRYGCGNPRCEDGTDVDTGEPCLVCPERLAARQAARRQEQVVEGGSAPELPAQRAPQPYRECACGDRLPADHPDTMCPRCRRDAEDAEKTARLRAQLAAQFGTPDEVDAYCNQAPF
ncbi:hypothetical protein ACPB9J_33825 [Streptomyces lavendulocolor]|uniref:hypothetical protein n=1 Tax=Streptomyces lavendulocolor TaxID=67316 RepID=UPI003C2C8C29